MFKLIVLFTVFAFANAYALDEYDCPGRIVAIGDSHGDVETLAKLLASRNIAIIDTKANWMAGNTCLVFTGDILDRGPGSRLIMDLIIQLESQAQAASGKVIFLLGNHEIMNLMGDLRYVMPDEFAQYSRIHKDEDEHAKIQDFKNFAIAPKDLVGSFYDEYIVDVFNIGRSKKSSLGKWLKDFLMGDNQEPAEARKALSENIVGAFSESYAKGYFNKADLFSKDGYYGKWLLQHDAIAKVNGVLFMHGGLSPKFGFLKHSTINAQIRDDLKTYYEALENLKQSGAYSHYLSYDDLRRLTASELYAKKKDSPAQAEFKKLESVFAGPLFSEDGPFWYRGLAIDELPVYGGFQRNQNVKVPGPITEDDVDDILKSQKASHIVIGHTQDKSLKVTQRFGGRVWMIDTGMNQKVYSGTPQALQIRKQGKNLMFEALTLEGHSSLPPRKHGRQ